MSRYFAGEAALSEERVGTTQRSDSNRREINTNVVVSRSDAVRATLGALDQWALTADSDLRAAATQSGS